MEKEKTTSSCSHFCLSLFLMCVCAFAVGIFLLLKTGRRRSRRNDTQSPRAPCWNDVRVRAAKTDREKLAVSGGTRDDRSPIYIVLGYTCSMLPPHFTCFLHTLKKSPNNSEKTDGGKKERKKKTTYSNGSYIRSLLLFPQHYISLYVVFIFLSPLHIITSVVCVCVCGERSRLLCSIIWAHHLSFFFRLPLKAFLTMRENRRKATERFHTPHSPFVKTKNKKSKFRNNLVLHWISLEMKQALRPSSRFSYAY